MATKKPTRKPRKRKTAQDAIANFELQSKYALTLQDKFDMIRMSLQAVIQGYSNARFIIGCLEKNTQITIQVDDELFDAITNKK